MEVFIVLESNNNTGRKNQIRRVRPGPVDDEALLAYMKSEFGAVPDDMWSHEKHSRHFKGAQRIYFEVVSVPIEGMSEAVFFEDILPLAIEEMDLKKIGVLQLPGGGKLGFRWIRYLCPVCKEEHVFSPVDSPACENQRIRIVDDSKLYKRLMSPRQR